MAVEDNKISNLESRVAKIEARLENKKEDIHGLNKELINERNTMVAVREDIAEMKALLNEWHEDNRELLKVIDNLEEQVSTNTTDIQSIYSIINTLKFIIMLVFGSGVFLSYAITKLFG